MSHSTSNAERDASPPRLRVGRRIPLDEFDRSATLACIDGRHEHPIVGAPGGDAGELVLLLSALEDAGGEVFSQPEVLAILEAYMENEGRFYLHTDRAALDELQTSLEKRDVAPWSAARDAGTPMDQWVSDPPFGVRPLLLRWLVEPKHVGCGHLKTLLEHPKSAGVRRGLVEAVIQAFLQMLWRGAAEPEFVVLEGRHVEQSIVVVEGYGDAEVDDVPEIEPQEGADTFFVMHLPVRRQLWRRNLEFLAEAFVVPQVELADIDTLLEDVESRAEQQLETTIQALAPSLPIWTASVSGTSVEVTRG